MKLRQCTCCKYFAAKGALYNGQFICRDCEQEDIEEREQDCETREWAELVRLENEGRVVRMY